ncbi:MAG: FtsI protein [Candidatus Wolfebacteria bacterium GW2011_GWE1_48_7]|nr:MAG: FtsI protein [Candidatus Wolfebacteria bacterium GW2011_GWE1_48_7]
MFKLDENFQTKKDPSVGSNKLERGFAEKTLEKDVLGMEDKALELKKRGDARLEEALELCGLETEQIARIKKELKIDEKMRDINIRANNSLARAFHFVKKTITVGLAFLAFSGDAMTGQAQTDGYEKILEEVTMRMKEIASDSAKEIRRTLQEHIASKEYLDKLALEFDGDLGMAEDAQKRRLEYLTSTSSEFMSYDDIQIENDFTRQYEEPGMFSHVTGYVGLVSDKDMEKDSDLLLNDLIGKSGLELQYDEELRGTNGATIDYRNAKNESLGQQTEIAPERGRNAYLTIDGGLQTYFYGRLKEQLENMGRTAGAGIAMDPDTGEILAMVSLPTFDNNEITREDLVNPNRPLFNRVVSGLYNPASTIKPLVATAALHEGVVDTNKSVYSKGYIEIPNPYHPDQPSRFVDWKAHGWVNVYSALARSSNIYFYATGGGFEDIKGLGIERLRSYWHTFGLDEKTGIDMPGEKVGFLPSIEEKEERTKLPWRIGDTYNVSIGQGDLTTTPIELINYIASISTKGKMYRPFIMKKLVNEKGETIKEQQPEILRDISQLAGSMNEVEKGMIETTQKEYGTAKLLKNLPFVVAGKTGSAQVSMKQKTNAFFTGYGPVGEEKKIVILVLIEDAREGGSNSVPVAYDVFRWYYENRISK